MDRRNCQWIFTLKMEARKLSRRFSIFVGALVLVGCFVLLVTYTGTTCEYTGEGPYLRRLAHTIEGENMILSAIDTLGNRSLSEYFNDRPDYCSKYCHQSSISGVGFPQIIFEGRFSEYVGAFAFRDMSDLVISWPNDATGSAAKETKDFVMRKVGYHKVLRCLGPAPIIYVKANTGNFLEFFYTSILPYLPLGAIVISGQSDVTIGGTFESWEIVNDHRLIHYFGENSVVRKDEKFTLIPIGLMFLSQPAGIEPFRQNEKEDLSAYISKVLYEVKNGERKKLMAINFSPRENFRKRLVDLYCNNPKYDFVECLSMPGCKVMQPGSCKYDQIYGELRKYPFWLAPSGNGLDTHRHYEAMYLNRIPIVASSPLDPLLHDLPVLLMDDLKTITREFLIQQLVIMRKRTGSFNLGKLTAKYWQEKIEKRRSDHLRLFNFTSDVRKRCWGPYK